MMFTVLAVVVIVVPLFSLLAALFLRVGRRRVEPVAADCLAAHRADAVRAGFIERRVGTMIRVAVRCPGISVLGYAAVVGLGLASDRG